MVTTRKLTKPKTAARKSKQKPTAAEMLDQISDEMSRLGDEITALPNGPGKVMLLERLVASYDMVIATLKEKMTQHRLRVHVLAEVTDASKFR